MHALLQFPFLLPVTNINTLFLSTFVKLLLQPAIIHSQSDGYIFFTGLFLTPAFCPYRATIHCKTQAFYCMPARGNKAS
jgi:hypothetical protein